MDLYNQTSYELSRHLTERYSTSFSMSSRLFSRDIKPHIYAIYGLVRIADEIVDTYQGNDAATLLEELEHDTERAMKTGYSPNPIVHAFAVTARKYAITPELTRPFFASMRMDLQPQTYTGASYREYIYGSAEVIGLMCLRVFTSHDPASYDKLRPGAQALGAAYQKVNFLRDIYDDYSTRQRIYFPGVTFETFDDTQKRAIEADIEQDFAAALPAIQALPREAKNALQMSYDYYWRLFIKIKETDADTIKSTRLRLSNPHKVALLTKRMLTR